MKPKHVAALLLLLAVAAPVSIRAGVRMTTNVACADGTCCPEPESDCIINNNLTLDHYAKLSGGSCRKPTDS